MVIEEAVCVFNPILHDKYRLVVKTQTQNDVPVYQLCIEVGVIFTLPSTSIVWQNDDVKSILYSAFNISIQMN